jgi:hypothetical protein
VTYPEVRPGVDLVFHGEEGRLEYDFVVAPGASTADAELAISGAESLSLDEAGALLIHTRSLVLRQPRPAVYQDDARGVRHWIQAEYRLIGDTRLAFAIGEHDETRSLIIDPVLLYSSYLGGSSFDVANAVAVDGMGNVYVAGFTTSPDFPMDGAIQKAIGGSTDAFVAKLDPTGTQLLYATYLGGSSEDEAYGVAVDGGGNIYVTGSTLSADFPGVPPQSDGGPCAAVKCQKGGASNAFVVKLDPLGNSFVYSTYLGGSVYDAALGIAVDALGDAYVAGFTQSPDFPTVTPFQSTLRGVQNAFIAELAPSGTKLVGSTYLGGSANDATATGNDAATSIAVDSLGGVYVAGYTQSADFPVAHAFQKSLLGSQNAFVAKLLPSFDTLAFSTYVGGSGTDVANAIAVDASNDVFLAGATTSADFPVLGGFQTRYAGQQDAFITEIAAAGNALVYSTFLGGSGTDLASSLALDGSGAAIVVGQTQSVDFPMLGAFQNRNNAPTTAIGNAFAAIVEPSGRHLVGSTYFGGEGGARAQAVAIGAGGAGNAFWMVGGAGANMPTANALYPSYKAQPPNGQNAFLTRLASDAGIELSPDAGGVALDGGPEASNEADGPCVVVVPAASDPQVSRPASSGCGCRVSETQRPPFAEVLGGAIFFGVLSGRRRRSRAATNQ